MASDVMARDMFMNIHYSMHKIMEDEILVEAIRRRNILYDVASMNYRNTDKKECAWREIADEIDGDGKHFSVIAIRC